MAESAQMVEYDPDDYVRRDEAIEAANMLYAYLEGNGENEMAQVVGSIGSVLSARKMETNNSMYGARVTFVDADGETHTGIVMEPHVTEVGHERCYDPHLGEYVEPSEYPLGTVQLVYTPEGHLSEDVFFDRLDTLEVATSVQPATGPEDVHCYYPGWSYADDS
jgi:hypothetical protein